jgi:hypothetical protein
MHASTVGLVRNLQTGSITPQFHMVYDDFFETVHSEEGQEPEKWGELLEFGRFKSDYDDEDYVPELSDEWLNPDDLRDRERAREQERADILSRRNVRDAPPDVDDDGPNNQDRARRQPRASNANAPVIQAGQPPEPPPAARRECF